MIATDSLNLLRFSMRYCFLTLGDMARTSNLRLINLGREMAARGVNISYLIEDYPTNQDFSPFNGAEIIMVPRRPSPTSIRARRQAIRKLEPDFVHVLNPSLKATLTLAGQTVRIVGDWEEWVVLLPRAMDPIRDAMASQLDNWLLRHSSLHVVASQYMREQFFARRRIEALYLPYATYLEHWPDTPSPYPEPSVAYLGNLAERFDADLMFLAMDLLKSRGQTPRLSVIGAGEDLAKWKRFCAERRLDHITLHGYLDWSEACARLRHAHLLVFPIRPTPFNLSRCPGKVYVYAQARRPIVTCRVGEVPYTLGDHAQYVEPTAEAFADAISKAMSQPHLPDVDYKIEHHNWSVRAETLLNALQRLL